ncbi:guanine nucleotide-binding protein-like 3 homolog isoform X2 [Limulus polyphemus]|uniref:Guanine nucleotide-binding protein-like 3 homolog isoform X2 n=1 Tax=Limulus polyphemus TaxID=6850 RepID=A0ABM1B1N3_LIMPO|nr:guanine nucleotide-binding protein-like 3 homolog isoform X2 [Limulus polyphemus]
MAKKFLRKKSKRMTCHMKYKIAKKVRQHHRKARKEAKKNPHKFKKKDPGVPNSLPFKEEILREAEERKRQAEEIKKRRQEERNKLLMEKRGLAELQQDAEKRGLQFDTKEATDAAGYHDIQADSSLRVYHKEFKMVVERADVVLEILDARDPLGCRCPQVEQAVINSGPNKRLVLVLNKIDLIPKDNLMKWLHYLRNEFPTVAFKASTQTQQHNLAHSKVAVLHSSTTLINSSRCLGANILMKVLGNYCRNQGIKTSITVGVVGFPNVGKSSIINSLKRSKVCTVGATPGVTKGMQEIQLDKHIKLLDSPGVVFAKGASDTAVALRNAVKVETLKDPITPVETILQRANKEQLMLYYRLPEYSSHHEFLGLLAKRMGRLKKGGIADIEAAARKLLTDWNIGKIKYYTHPPESQTLPAHISAELVAEMGKAFDIDSLENEEEKELNGIPLVLPSDAILVESTGLTEGVMEENEDGQGGASINMEVETTRSELSEAVTIDLPKKKQKSSKEASQKLPDLLQMNKEKKVAFKKMKKKLKKNEKVANKLSASLENAMCINTMEDYDFSTDFT